MTQPRPPAVVVGRIASAQIADDFSDRAGAHVLGRRVIMDGMAEDEPTPDRTVTATAVGEPAVVRAGSRR